MTNFTNVSSLTNIRCTFSLHQNEIIWEFLLAGWISPMFHHSPTSNVLFLFIKMRSIQNFSNDDESHQCFIIDQHSMYFFSSSKWDQFRISLTMMNLTNVSSLTNIRCTFSLHQNEIIWEFLLAGWISPMFHHSPTSNVLFLFIKMRSIQNFSNDDESHQCFIIDQHSMYFFSSSKWDQFRISLTMMNLTNVSSLTNIRCTFSLHQNEIIWEFLLAGWISPMFHHWPTSDVLFLFIKIRSFSNFSYDDEFHQSFIVDQHSMYFFSSSKWDHFRISHIMINFNNISSFSKVQRFYVFIKMRSFQHFYHHDAFLQYSIVCQRPMFFFSSS